MGFSFQDESEDESVAVSSTAARGIEHNVSIRYICFINLARPLLYFN
jgi:hypothetical protein